MADFENVEDLDSPKKSKAPIVAAVVLLLGGAAAFFALNRGPSLTEEEKTAFDNAKGLLRSDDYNQYPAAVSTFDTLREKYPEYVEPVVWGAQTYLAWSESLESEARILSASLTPMQQKLQSLIEQKAALEKPVADKPAKAAPTEGSPVFPTMTIPQIEEEQKKTRAEFDLVKAAYEGKLTEMRENKDKGFKLAEQALRMNLTDPQAQRVIADYYRMNKKWKEAEDALEFVAKAKPRSAGLRFIRGMIAKDRDNDCKKAVELFQDALTVDDKFNKARFYLAVCTDELGDKEKAAGIMKMVLTQAANHPGAKAYLKYSDVLADAKRAAAEAAATQAEVGGAAAEGAKN